MGTMKMQMEEAGSGKHHSLLRDSTRASPESSAARRNHAGRPSRDDPARPLFMLLEPRQGGKAERFMGDVAKDQPVPGSGLVEPPHLLPESGQPMVKFR